MNLPVFLLLIASLAGLLISAFFSATEVAVFSIKPPMLKSLRERDPRRADWIHEVLMQPRRFLITILLGNAIANATVACGITLLFLQYCPLLQGCHWWVPMAITIVLLILFGELLPKAIARHKSGTIALGFIGPLRMVERLVRPTSSTLDLIANKWAIRMAPSGTTPLRGLSDDEYVTMLDVGMREGALSPGERLLIEKALRLADRNLRELMTPRSEMCGLDVEMDLVEMRSKASTMKHRRLPIYSGSPDSVVGILNVRRFLLQPNTDFMECIEPPAFVPETMTALELLKNFLRGPQRMALVVDEFGGVEGLITLENIVEEVFGDILDEYDDEPPAWEQLESHAYVARGSAHLPDVSKWLGVDLEADGVDTLGGWITDRLGALPKVGDQCSFGGYHFQVEKMHRFRVGSVLVRDERKYR